jgi:hypothetical protein
MDDACNLPITSRKQRELQYRDGLLLALRSPRLLGRSNHDGLWASFRGRPLSAGRVYDIARARVIRKFGKSMGLHDFRRAAATFVAMDAPDKIGLIPGVLQHASPEPSEQYNLARSNQAGERYAAHLSKIRSRLRPLSTRNEG